MTPWLADPDVTLYHGDCLDVLRELPDRSVHMCATSPPFYGLRDYGTGEWEGGNPDCDHTPPKQPDRSFRSGAGVDGRNCLSWTERDGTTFKQECGKCGARRVDQQIGLEETPDQWVERLVAVFREVRRVLRDDGTLWVEIGDSYSAQGGVDTSGSSDGAVGRGERAARRVMATKPKDLLGQPWLLAFALRADGWYLRSEIIWARPNPMPESVTDRPTKSHSTVFLLSKQPRYFYDADAIREHGKDNPGTASRNPRPGVDTNGGGQGSGQMTYPPTSANARSVWQIPTEPTPYAHFATWPQALVRRMILAGTSERGCCPECGAPWVRDVERVATTPGVTGGATPYDSHRPDGMTLRAGGFGNGSATTLGWSPSCHHNNQPVPAVVLDPFAGSGTTSLVARNHGRHSIGIELNAAYLRIAGKRLQQLSLLAGVPDA